MNDKEIIKKIKLLKEVKPQAEWVFSCRSRLALKLETERKKELLSNDLFALKELFAFWRIWQPRFILRLVYALLMILGVGLAGGGLTVWAASQSLPGSPLYPVKIALEQARLIIASSGESKIKLQTEIASRRLEELSGVLATQETPEQKRERVEQVVSHIQQQLITVKDQLPKATSGKAGLQKAVAAAKAVSEKTEQIEKTLVQAKESLPAEVKQSLGAKLTEAAEAADKTNTQALEIMAKQDQSEAGKKEILAKVEEKIQKTEGKIKSVEQKMAQATSTDDKLPTRAVLIKDQSDKAQELLEQAKESLGQEDVTGALENIKVATEIVAGAEKMAENAGLPSNPASFNTEQKAPQNTASTSPVDASSTSPAK